MVILIDIIQKSKEILQKTRYPVLEYTKLPCKLQGFPLMSGVQMGTFHTMLAYEIGHTSHVDKLCVFYVRVIQFVKTLSLS